MRLWIFSTRKDLSLPRIVEEAKKINTFSPTSIYYEDLAVDTGDFWYRSKDGFKHVLDIQPDDKIIVRWPWDADDTSVEYNIFVYFILLTFGEQVVFDRKCLRQFTPYYEDKLFQSLMFKKLTVPTPDTFYFTNIAQLKKSDLQYPLVLKKRVSSRSKNNFLLSSEDQCVEKLKNMNIADYIFQRVITIEHDVRIVVLRNEVVGAVNRFTHLREGNRLAVKGREVFENIPQTVVDCVLKIKSQLGADFVGFDVLFEKNGAFHIIEANLSPQFDKFEDATGINVAEKLMRLVG